MKAFNKVRRRKGYSHYLSYSSTRVLDYWRTDGGVGWRMRVEAQCLKLGKVSKIC